MNDISDINKDGLPSTKSLLKATLVAIAGAALVLVTAILPAEYGIDPTGVGKAMGLTVLNQSIASEVEPTPVLSKPDNLLAAVIVQTSKKNIPENVIEKAAIICAKFSTDFAGTYEVDFTQRRNVKIQHEANVLYNPYTTIVVKT